MNFVMTVNGSAIAAIIPENDVEEAFIKMLMKQDNEFLEVRNQTHILGKAFTKGLIIQPKSRAESYDPVSKEDKSEIIKDSSDFG
jgi:hypothetical protein